jgi:ATP-dependent NAD(P)H-hydrate dehydratase
LDPNARKGRAGRIAVVGGCAEYTGAPYFAAISALKTGCDVVHVFCTKAASTVIKSYSPELITHPYLLETSDLFFSSSRKDARTDWDDLDPLEISESDLTRDERDAIATERAVKKICRWLKNVDAVVVGPGLGRDPCVIHATRRLLEHARAYRIPIVVDADGLFVVRAFPECVRGNPNVVLTPNANEFRGLVAAALGGERARALDERSIESTESIASIASAALDSVETNRSVASRTELALEVSHALEGVGIFSKGPVDIGACVAREDRWPAADPVGAPPETNERRGATRSALGYFSNGASGSFRRCGGQGDVLAGTLATFLAWASTDQNRRYRRESVAGEPELDSDARTLGVAEKVSSMAHASAIVRDAAREAFGVKKRAMVTSDIVETLGASFESAFPWDEAPSEGGDAERGGEIRSVLERS